MLRLLPLLLLGVIILTLGLAGCNDDPEADTSKDTLGDPLGDIAALGNYLYAANEDWSGHAGSQVDLFKFDHEGFSEDRFGLGINGAGYLAATADSHFVYLQAQETGRLFKVSPVGEIAWVRDDPEASGSFLAQGVTYDAAADSFSFLYHHHGTTTYTITRLGPGCEGPIGSRHEVTLDAFSPDRGAQALAILDDTHWVLGTNAEGGSTLQGTDLDGAATQPVALADDSACGVAAAESGLWLAYPDRRFDHLSINTKVR